MLLARASRIVRHALYARRPLIGVATNGISSLGNLTLAVGIARTSSVDDFGRFAVAFSLYLLVVGLCRSAVTEGVLSSPTESRYTNESSRLLVAIATVCGGLAAIGGVVTDISYLWVLGIALPGLAIFDHIKTLSLGAGQARIALIQEALWTVSVIVSLGFASAFTIDATCIFVIWAMAGAVIGGLQAVRLGMPLRPSWAMEGLTTRTTVGFGLEYLAGSGIAQLSTSVLMLVAGAPVVGRLRAAGTVLAPCTLIVGTARGLLIPYFARHIHDGTPRLLWRASALGCVLLAAIGLAAAAIASLPNAIGLQLMGESWAQARPALPALVGELIFAAITAVLFALHRVEGAGFRGLAIEAGMAPARLIAIVAGAHYFGAAGAAWAMAGIAMIGACLWWTSYARLQAAKRDSIRNRSRIAAADPG